MTGLIFTVMAIIADQIENQILKRKKQNYATHANPPQKTETTQTTPFI